MSDNENNNPEPNPKTETNGEQESKTETKTFTQDDIDRIITERLKQERLAQERKDAERMKQMEIEKLSGEEKIKAQHKAEIDKILAEKEEAIKSNRLLKASNDLAKLGYDTNLAQMVIGADDDETADNIKNLDKCIKALVQKQVQENLARGSPNHPDGGNTEGDRLRNLVRQSAGLR